MAGPSFFGSFQVTSRLLPDPAVAVTLGADGADGASSSSSSTVMTTSLDALPPFPSTAFTLTLYLHVVCGLPLASTLCPQGASSKFRLDFVFICPVLPMMVNELLSGPSRL